MRAKQEGHQLEEGLDCQPLPEHIHDKQTSLNYRLVDETYYLPEDGKTESNDGQLGLWGRRRLRFLAAHRRPVLLEMKLSGTLAEHLRETDRSAEALFERLTSQMVVSEGVDEQLKLKNQMAWVRAVNSIHQRATEIVRAEFIHT